MKQFATGSENKWKYCLNTNLKQAFILYSLINVSLMTNCNDNDNNQNQKNIEISHHDG